MAKLICEVYGVRGRKLSLYDTKCVIYTDVSLGSILTNNATDGEKTIFLCDVSAVQFKKSGALIGYLQLETPSMQMNNGADNFYNENTFTFRHGINGVTNEIVHSIYEYIVERIEELKCSNYPESSIVLKLPKASTEDSVNWSIGKCEHCRKEEQEITYCKYEDDFGTKYRDLCSECMNILLAIPTKRK